MMLFFMIGIAIAQQISFIDSYNDSYVLYNDSKANPNFIWQHPFCCTPPKLQIINVTQQVGDQNILNLTFSSFSLIKMKAHLKGGAKSTINITEKQNGSIVTINNTCVKKQMKSNQLIDTSGMAEVKMQVQNQETQEYLNLHFNYWLLCLYDDMIDSHFQIQLPFSYVVIAIPFCNYILVVMFSVMNKIKSMKLKISNPANNSHIQRWMAVQIFSSQDNQVYFQGFRVTYWVYAIYLIATIVFYLLVNLIFPDNWYNVVLGIVLVLSFLFTTFFFNEIFCHLNVNWNLQRDVLKCFRICDILSILISITFIVLYVYFHQPWPLSFLIATFITGALAKLFKIISFREIFIVYILILIYDTIYYSIVLNRNDRVYTIEVLEYTNFPILFEIPQVYIDFNKICIWWSVIDLFVPAVAIAYCYRFDVNRKSNSFFVTGQISYVVGLSLWGASTFYLASNGKQLSQQFFIIPCLVIFSVLWAKRQGELSNFWYGQFYDGYLIDHLQLDYKDSSIIKNFEAELVSEKSKDLYKGLKFEQ